MSHLQSEADLILLVEDDELQRETQSAYLSEFGYHVLHASNGEMALEALSEHPEITLLLSDVNLPGVINGDGLAQWILIYRPEVPVILVSALGRQYPIRAVRHRFVSKPYALEDMVTLIRRLLRPPS